MSLIDARGLAEAREMDVVEVAPEADPPVCRIMDFHKFRYEQRKKTQESKRKSSLASASVKEVKVRSRTEAHDIDFKMGHIRRFLEKGHRVKISVFFKGREITRPELGRATLEKVLESLEEVCTPDGTPRMEGRHMSVMVVPNRTTGKKASKGETHAENQDEKGSS